MGKCENCKKYEDCKESGFTWPCGAYVPKTITNFERIAASPEALAPHMTRYDDWDAYAPFIAADGVSAACSICRGMRGVVFWGVF